MRAPTNDRRSRVLTQPTGDDEAPLTLHQLIRSRMQDRGWSYTDLALRSGQVLTRGRWQQLGSGVRQKNFPDPSSLLVIAQVLEVDITAVVLAAAQALGLDAHSQGSDLAHLLPPRIDRLSARKRDAILNLIRAAVADTLAGHHESSARLTGGPQGLTLNNRTALPFGRRSTAEARRPDS